MIKRLRLKEFGSVKNIIIEEVTLDKPQKGEVKIKVKAAGLNRDQLPYIYGTSNYEDNGGETSSLLGYEASGIVLEVGEGVEKSWLGKEVMPVGPFNVRRYGTTGEEAYIPADRLIEKPKKLDFNEATTIWVPFITAYGMIYKGNLKKGETVLISAANSVVGLAAYEIAESIGAKPVAVVRSEKVKKDLEKEGIKNIVVSTLENFKENIMKFTNNEGIDLVYDPIGGEFLTTACDLLKIKGRIVEYGVLGGFDTKFPVVHVISKGLTISGFAMSEILSDEILLEKVKKFILKGIEDGKFHPRIAKIFKLTDYKDAYEELENGKEIGRIILNME